MADNPNPDLDLPETAAPEAKPKKKGIKRRIFLAGSALVVGGGIFGVWWSDKAAKDKATALAVGEGEHGFLTWMKIAEDDTVTVYSPHIDFGQGSHTALGQMLADELDAAWDKVKIEQAPADFAFANAALAKGFLPEMAGETVAGLLPDAVIGMMARTMPIQITGGSSAVRFTGEVGMRKTGAAVRMALIAEAADRLGVPAGELTTADSKVTHAKSGKSLRYGELAAGAAERSLSNDPVLKTRDQWKLIGQPIARRDIPAKVDGSAVYGIDFTLPEMRVATIAAAPVRGGKLESVDEAPALAVNGVEKVVKLDDAVIVVGKGYWPALKGLQALSPKFSDGGHAAVSTPAIYAAQAKLMAGGKPDNEAGEGDVDGAFKAAGAKVIEAEYRVPFLHHAMMEPFALTGHFNDGTLTIWGGLQDPLSTRARAAKAAGLDVEQVVFNPMIMGGGFGRRFPDVVEIIDQVAILAKQVPYPVKLVWSREEEVRHGTYRPQSSSKLSASLKDGKISAMRIDYAQSGNAEGEVPFIYAIPATSRRHFAYQSNQIDGPWRSVNSTQLGFYTESFMDELAAAAGEDPYQFRRKHLPAGSRHLAVLDEVAKRSGWGTPLPEGVGRGIAIVESFGTIVAEVIEASVKDDGSPKVLKAWAVVDCGTTINPLNAEAQIAGGLIMSLSAAIGEQITLDQGAVVESNFGDYPILKLADAPPQIDVHFIESGAKTGGIGEPGVPPATPALANALAAVSGKRIRTLPLLTQAKA
ncbi:xanthine dehydrogenase family protein molybdopterin-binding subunit [Porphyrobacter sp. LM 6]|uniref:xanthine dehydrogenase family protein molybdopterin-binding subunit n=1 Tax=Porphyrobacter sp. LM 6 TaxID=1896196 RepID=UPI0008639678|nr:molybdopterin cofactor-binding domain-containing protein [Porphyrobacter sp. LM 6]AOL94468.1 isoquinoline 1-oxidoreductase, beta subunit [Porphyrobacter sp. LM 6]